MQSKHKLFSVSRQRQGCITPGVLLLWERRQRGAVCRAHRPHVGDCAGHGSSRTHACTCIHRQSMPKALQRPDILKLSAALLNGPVTQSRARARSHMRMLSLPRALAHRRRAHLPRTSLLWPQPSSPSRHSWSLVPPCFVLAPRPCMRLHEHAPTRGKAVQSSRPHARARMRAHTRKCARTVNCFLARPCVPSCLIRVLSPLSAPLCLHCCRR